MMRPDAKVQKVYLYPKPVDFRKSINGLAALVELDIKVEVFNPVLFVFLNRTRSQVKILYWERNGLAMLLTTKYADGIPLYRFEKMLGRHGIDIPRQTLARWVIQSGEQLQPLLSRQCFERELKRRRAIKACNLQSQEKQA